MAGSKVILLLLLSLTHWMLIDGTNVQEVGQQEEGDDEMEQLLEKMYRDENAEDQAGYDNPDTLRQHFNSFVTKQLSDFTASKRFSQLLGDIKTQQSLDQQKDKRFSEFMGGKKRFSEFMGGKKRFSEFMGGKKRFSEFMGGKKRFSEFMGGK